MMKRTIRILLMSLLILSAVTVTCSAEPDIEEAQQSALDISELEDAITDEVSDAMGDIEISGNLNLSEGISNIVETTSEKLPGLLKKTLKSSVMILAAVLMCGMLDTFWADGEKIKSYVPLVGAMAVSAIAVVDVNYLAGVGADAINDMKTFADVLLPTLAAAVAASGGATAAAAKQVATVFFSDVLINLINSVLMPFVYAYMAVCVAGAVTENAALYKMASFIKWLVITILTFFLTAFITYLVLSGVISGATDVLAVKAVKTSMSSVPVVGGIISDAAETVLAGAAVLKNAVGVFGLLAIVCICLIPIIRIGTQYLMYKLTAAVCATVGDDKLVKLIENIGGAFGIIFGMTTASALMLFISIISSVSAVIT